MRNVRNPWMRPLAALALAVAAGCNDDGAIDDPVAAAPAPGVHQTSLADPSGLPAADVVSEDFNGDGIADLAVLSAPSAPAAGSTAAITIYAGPVPAGSGGDIIGSYPVPPAAGDFDAADLNQDGMPDFVIAIGPQDPSPGRLHIIFRSADGSVIAENELFSGFNATSLTTADIDGDGMQDVIAADGSNTLVARAAPAPARSAPRPPSRASRGPRPGGSSSATPPPSWPECPPPIPRRSGSTAGTAPPGPCSP